MTPNPIDSDQRCTLAIRSSDDVVRVRQQVRVFAVEVGLSLVDQTKIVTAASELARKHARPRRRRRGDAQDHR